MPLTKSQRKRRAKAARKKALKPKTVQTAPLKQRKGVVVKLPLTTRARQTVSRNRGMMSMLGYLAKTITLPAESEPVRFPNYSVGTDQTGTFHLTTTTSVNMLNYASGTQQFLLTGSPIAPVWCVQDAGSVRYHRYYVSAATVGAGPWDAYLGLVADSNAIPCYPGQYQGKTWVYVPAGISFIVNAVDFVGAGPAVVTWKAMNVIGNVVEGTPWSIPLTNGVGVLSIAAATQATWYTIDQVACTSGALATAFNDIQVAAGRAMWPRVICPSLSAVSPTLEHMRVNSSAVLITNVSKPLYVNGTITAARLVGGDTSVFTPADVRTKISVVNERLRYSGEAAKGCYSYYIPTDDSLSFSDYRGRYSANYNSMGAAASLPVLFDLRDFTHVNAIDFDCDAATGLSFKIRHDMHLEFQSDAEIFKLDVPRISIDEFFTVITAASRMVPFTENPVHMAQLLFLAKQMLRFLAPRLIPHAQQAIMAGAKGVSDWMGSYM